MQEDVIFDFGRRIEEICETNHITKYQLMKKAGICHTSFYNMCNGKQTTPNLDHIRKICSVVDLDFAGFFTYQGEGPVFTKKRLQFFMEMNELDDNDFSRLEGYYRAIMEEKKNAKGQG